jgi:hypothetical protein
MKRVRLTGSLRGKIGKIRTGLPGFSASLYTIHPMHLQKYKTRFSFARIMFASNERDTYFVNPIHV